CCVHFGLGIARSKFTPLTRPTKSVSNQAKIEITFTVRDKRAVDLLAVSALAAVVTVVKPFQKPGLTPKRLMVWMRLMNKSTACNANGP
ncbi:MAG: hypothetical protein AAF497_02075, partial [Planctomycetota bacterium]